MIIHYLSLWFIISVEAVQYVYHFLSWKSYFSIMYLFIVDWIINSIYPDYFIQYIHGCCTYFIKDVDVETILMLLHLCNIRLIFKMATILPVLFFSWPLIINTEYLTVTYHALVTVFCVIICMSTVNLYFYSLAFRSVSTKILKGIYFSCYYVT